MISPIRKFLHTFIGTLFSAVAIMVAVSLPSNKLYAQTQGEIEMAKQLARQQGYSEAQIESMIKGSSNTTVVQKTVVSDAVDRNVVLEMPQATPAAGGRSSIFGHNIFKSKNLNFVPSYNIPTPDNYKLSAGDEVIIDVWGDVVTNITATISPEGSISIPEVGPVYLMGQTVATAEKNMKDYLSKIYSGIKAPTPTTFVKIALGKIRSFTINILGEVENPGTYTLPSLSTMASALYLAGGPTDLGSIRDIKLYRNNKLTSTFDVYEFIANGKFSSNVRLEDNDVVIVGPYINIVEIKGPVKRPMRYEIKDSETLDKLVEYAGGFSDNANISFVHVDRIKAEGEISITGAVAQSFDIPADKFSEFKMQDGDVVTVNANSGRFQNRVEIAGAVWYPGTYSISDDVKSVKQLLQSAGGLTEEAYTGRAYIVRLGEDRQREQVSFNLNDLILGKINDIELMPDDRVRIYSNQEIEPNTFIIIDGEVNTPGKRYEFRSGMTIGDAILMAGGVTQAATLSRVEISRRIKALDDKEVNSKLDISDTVAVILKYNLLQNPNDAGVQLEPFDIVYVYRSAMYVPQQAIADTGEVVFPGKYVVEKNVVRLSDIINRAKGFTDDAYVKGAKLTRRMTSAEKDRVFKAMQIAGRNSDTTTADLLEIGDTYTVAIDMEAAMANPGSVHDIVLRENDVISVPKIDYTVKIVGAVFYPNTVSFNPKATYRHYISSAGGYSNGAVKRKAYMIHMNGAVAMKGTKDFKVQPGTEIVVPKRDMNRAKRMSLGEILGLSSAMASVAAIVVSILRL